MNIQHYFHLFIRYLWLTALIVALSLVGMWMWLNTQKPVYASRATLQIEWEKDKVMDKINDVQDGRLTGLDALNTEVKAITSSANMLAVADALGRSAELAKTSPQGKITPENETQLVNALRSQLNVQLQRGTRLIDIVAEAESPTKAAEVALKVSEVFLEGKEQGKKNSSRGAGEYLFKEAALLRDKLLDSEKKLVEYKLNQNAISLNERENLVSQRLTTLTNQVTEANTRRIALESDLKILEVAGDKVEELLKVPSVQALPEVANLKSQLVLRESEFDALKARYLELHPKHIAQRSLVKETKDKLDAAVTRAGVTLKQQFEVEKEKEEKLRAMQKEAEKASFELDKVSVPYKLLQDEISMNRELYKATETRLKEVGVVTGLNESNYVLLEKPLENGTPIRPNKSSKMLLAGFGSLGFCLALIFLIDYLDSSIRTVDDAESFFSLPVLAAIPEAKAELLKGTAVMAGKGETPQAEGFRNLRASLSLLGEESKRRLFLITSAIPSEGKTFTSTNLAASFAIQGFKTILIDADLRRPALSANLMETIDRKHEEYRGLSDVLSGVCKPEDAMCTTEIANLTLLPSGRKSPNPGELLAQLAMESLLEKFLGEYDRVVVDSAPVNAVSDALTLAPLCHTVCVVMRYGKTPRRAINRAITLLQKNGAKIAGLVMNRMPTSRSASYYYYYYGEGYADKK